MSATITTLDERIVPYIQNICQRDPFSGRTVTGGIVTARDSGCCSAGHSTVSPSSGISQGPARGLDLRPVQQHARRLHQKAHAGLHRQGDLHGVAVSSGVPENQIEDLAEHSANTVPVMMPYITAFFMPRTAGDRPAVVPEAQ